MSEEEFPLYGDGMSDDLGEYEHEDVEMDDVPELQASVSERHTPAWRTHRRQAPVSICTNTTSTVRAQRVATPAPFATAPHFLLSPKHTETFAPSPKYAKASPKLLRSPTQLLRRRLQNKKKTLQTEFADRLARLRLPILPLFPMPNGAPHPNLPKTLLQFHLLTEPELDAIAAHYHQITPTNVHRFSYPACMNWDSLFLLNPDTQGISREEKDCCLPVQERVAIKRRMIGKFLGIGGCLTPEVEVVRRLRFYEEWIAMTVRRKEKMKEESEKKDIYWRGGWGA